MDQPERSAPPELQARLQQASEMAEEGRWDEAFELLRDQEEQYPTDATLLCMLGVAAEEVNAPGLAYDYFRRSLAEQPTDPYVLVPLGVGLARYDDPDAEGVLRLAAISAPGLSVARLQYGAYLAREGQLDLALEELSAARRLDESDPRVARELGVASLLAGRTEAALDELERGVGLAADDGEIQLLLGLVLVQAGRLEEAAEALYRASSALPEDGEAQLLSALASAAQGWTDQAWDALSRAELAEVGADPALLQEAEEAMEAGPDEAEALLRDEVAAPALHARLLDSA